MKIRILLILTVFLTALRLSAAESADTHTRVFGEKVRSLQVFEGASMLTRAGIPAMMLDSGAGIRVEFDILGDDRDNLRYELTHCNRNWRPSGMTYVEFLDGFNEGQVENYAFSNATNVHYVHYVINIPDGQMRPLISGNYLLKVYKEEDGPENSLLQVRFVVTEQTADISGSITSRTDVDYNRSHQQLALAVDTRRANIRSPFNDITVVIEQNGRTDNTVTIDKPLRVSGTTAFYEHDSRLIFKAGNEYRRFESASTNYPGMGIEAVEYLSPYYHAFVQPAQSRAGESYHYDETQSGAFTIREYNSDIPESALNADYIVTHFALDYPETPGFSFFIDSDAFQRRFSPESMLHFNRGTGRYELTTLLKQGQYSYQILAVPTGADVGRTDVIEGDKFETRNRYRVLVYRRMPGDRYDRLIGVGELQ